MTTFIHSGPGNIKAGISDGLAYAEVTFEDGTTQRFEEPINPNAEDIGETTRRQYSQASEAHQKYEAQQAQQKRIQEQSAILMASFADPAVFDALVERVARALRSKAQALQ